jgi:hypothetical protein
LRGFIGHSVPANKKIALNNLTQKIFRWRLGTKPKLVHLILTTNRRPIPKDKRMTNLIMPEPCTFIDPSLPECSVIRPGTTPHSGAVAAATALTNSNLFMGQLPEFFATLNALAQAADAARRIPEGPKK